MTLQHLFQTKNTQPVEYEGKLVRLSFDIPICCGEVERVLVLKSSGPYPKNVWLMMRHEKGEGYLRLLSRDGDIGSGHFNVDAAERNKFLFVLYPNGDSGILRVSNSWVIDNEVYFGYGNAGMYVEEDRKTTTDGRRSFVFHCSTGPGEIDFEEFVFQIELKRQP